MVGTLNQSKNCNAHMEGACAKHVWGVHMQCAYGGCTHNAHVGGAHAMHAWGVHVQCACGGCMCNACMGVHVQYVWGVVTPIN